MHAVLHGIRGVQRRVVETVQRVAAIATEAYDSGHVELCKIFQSQECHPLPLLLLLFLVILFRWYRLWWQLSIIAIRAFATVAGRWAIIIIGRTVARTTFMDRITSIRTTVVAVLRSRSRRHQRRR